MSSFGANPPPGMEWRIGKTAATIVFVQEAEIALLNLELTSAEAYQLQAKIDRMKSGDESLDEEQAVDDWLERLRDHYP